MRLSFLRNMATVNTAPVQAESDLMRELEGLKARTFTVSGKHTLQQIMSHVCKLETDVTRLKERIGVMSEMYVGTSGDVHLRARGEVIPLKSEVANKIQFLQTALASGMKEAQDRVVDFGDTYRPELIKILVIYLNLGPDSDYARLPNLEQHDILALMDLCTQMDLPEICLKLAQQLDKKAVDIPLLLLSHKHVEVGTCLNGWEHAYWQATASIASRIEFFSNAEGFSDLPLKILKDVIHHIIRPSRMLECDLSVPKASPQRLRCDGFEFEFRDTRDTLDLITSMTTEHRTPVRLPRNRLLIGQFQVEASVVSAVSGHDDEILRVSSSSDFISPTRILQLLSKPSRQLEDLIHGGESKVTVVVRMTKLHRQCTALLRYAAPRVDATADPSSSLLETLSYFYRQKDEEPASSECADNFSRILVDFVAMGFLHIRESISLAKLPCSAIEDIIKQDCLYTGRDELAVLKSVIVWSMEASRQKKQGPAQKRKRGDPDVVEKSASGVSDGDPFNRLIVHVRFPFISMAQLSELKPQEQKFARQYPLYKQLKSEAIKIQIESTNQHYPASTPRPSDPAANARAQRRLDYHQYASFDCMVAASKF